MDGEASGPQRGLQNGALAQRVLSWPGGEGCWDAPHCRLGPGRGGFPLGPKALSLESPEAAPLGGRARLGQEWGEMHSASSSL